MTTAAMAPPKVAGEMWWEEVLGLARAGFLSLDIWAVGGRIEV